MLLPRPIDQHGLSKSAASKWWGEVERLGVVLAAGNATIEGLSIREDMGSIYSLLGVCPQHDLLWEQLTPVQHLNFYGRLKNLRARSRLPRPRPLPRLAPPLSINA